jgi:hypothetical protein
MPIFVHSYLLLYHLILVRIFSSSLSPTLSTFKNHCPFHGSFICVPVLSAIFFPYILYFKFSNLCLFRLFFRPSLFVICVFFFLNNIIMMFIHFVIDVFGSFSSASFFFSVDFFSLQLSHLIPLFYLYRVFENCQYKKKLWHLEGLRNPRNQFLIF